MRERVDHRGSGIELRTVSRGCGRWTVTPTLLALGALVFLASVGIDFAHTKYVQAVQARECWTAASWRLLPR